MAVTVDGTTGVTAPTLSATGNVSATGNIIGGNIIGTIAAGANPITTTGNITGGNLLTSGLISATGDITGANITTSGANATIGSSTANATYNIGTGATATGQVKNIDIGVGGLAGSSTIIDIGPVNATTASAVATFNTATTVAIANTSGTALSVAGNITGGNVLGGANVNATTHTGTTVSVTGNITGGNVLGGANVNATTHTGTTVSVSANIDGGNLRTAGLISATGNVTAANVIVNGTAAAGSAVLIVSGNIQTTSANNTANIGNTSNYFNTVHAKATTAQYADVAELYTADAPYGPGTVLIFGGDQEVTAKTTSHSTAVAGVVSQNPSHLMNAGLTAPHVVAVALLGRVYCNVRGVIAKGDLLVTSDQAGIAEKLNLAQYQPGCVIGKSLENYNSDQVGRIEIAVGVK